MKPQTKHQAGFTIIELTLATAIFSVILLVISAGIVNFTKSYLKGVHQSQTQEVTRTVMSEISQAVQFSADFPPPVTDHGWTAYCFGNVKYSARLGVRFQSSDPANTHVLIRSPFDGVNCAPATTITSVAETELLGDNMRLQQFDITDNGNNSHTISLRVVYGAEDLNPGGKCERGAGSEFCAASALSTTVQRRL